MDKWLVVVNPSSGKGKGKKVLEELSSLLENEGISFVESFTTGQDSAISHARDFIDGGGRKIICVGGDGTLGEIVNGVVQNASVASSEVSIALVPNGTGNDWARTLAIPKNLSECVKVIKAEKLQMVDIGRVGYEKDGTEKYRYFINMAGFGFDAAVAREALETHFMGYRGTVTLYLLALVKTVFSYKKSDAMLTVDGREVPLKDVFSICIANGRYHGGGYLQAPEADPSDGVLHATIISGISKWGVIKNIKNLYDGSFVEDPAVGIEMGKSFRIDSTLPIDVELDGELLHYPFREISIIPKAIQFVVP